MICTIAAFETKRECSNVSRAVTRIYKANTNIYLCEKCDLYHVVVDTNRYPVNGLWQEMLSLLAQGMTRHEIARTLNVPVKTVDNAIFEMRKRFYALNRPHLVAIAISLGMVNPKSFVPEVEEHHANA